MSIMRRNPYGEMLSLREAMDRLLEEKPVASQWRMGTTFAIDMYEREEGLIVEAELPGLGPEDVEVSIAENRLTIEGEYTREREHDQGNVYFRERRYGSFQRSIPLPTKVDISTAEAEFEDGVLRITLPRPEGARPKQIEVKGKETVSSS